MQIHAPLGSHGESNRVKPSQHGCMGKSDTCQDISLQAQNVVIRSYFYVGEQLTETAIPEKYMQIW